MCLLNLVKNIELEIKFYLKSPAGDQWPILGISLRELGATRWSINLWLDIKATMTTMQLCFNPFTAMSDQC